MFQLVSMMAEKSRPERINQDRYEKNAEESIQLTSPGADVVVRDFAPDASLIKGWVFFWDIVAKTTILDACFMMDDLRRRDSECMVRHAVERRTLWRSRE